VLGVLGVITSLAFVAMEIRQNTNAVKSATVQEILKWSYEGSMVELEHPELRDAYRAYCDGTATDLQMGQIGSYYAALLRIQMNRFYQAQFGIIDEAMALDLGGRGGSWEAPTFRSVWPRLMSNFSPEFREFVEQNILPSSRESC
jgi:hypothetical protein